MHIITARTSNICRLEDHQIIYGLVSFDTDQGQIHVEVTIQPQKPRPSLLCPKPR